jgi:hypothetical protein
MDLLGAQKASPPSSLSALWQTGGVPNWPDPLSELARNAISDREDQAAKTLVPTSSTGAMKSLVTMHWQLITHETMGDQLYDWVVDPAESDNFAVTPQGQATVGEVKARMADVMKQK